MQGRQSKLLLGLGLSLVLIAASLIALRSVDGGGRGKGGSIGAEAVERAAPRGPRPAQGAGIAGERVAAGPAAAGRGAEEAAGRGDEEESEEGEDGVDASPETGFWLGPAGQDGGSVDGAEEDEPHVRCSLEGRVRLEGEPLADVPVRVFSTSGGGKGPVGGQVQTDTGGRFAIEPLPGGSYWISVILEGAFSRGVWVACQNDGERLSADVDLARAGIHVTGMLTDREGTPLALSSVTVRRRDMANIRSFRESLAVPVGADGRFELWLPDAGFDVVGDAVGHHGLVLPVPEGREEVELVFQLDRVSLLRGLVIGPTGPQSGVSVHASSQNDNGSSTIHRTTTGPDGRFTLECGPTEAIVTAWDGERWASRRVQPRQEGTDAPEIVLELQPGRSLSGRVHLADGSPVPMAEVACYSLPSGTGGGVQADIQGRFEISGLRPAEQVLVFCSADRRPWDERAMTIEADLAYVEILFVPMDE
ncbi:MAG: carboxypeptidase regulatory-like domain-containing protein [Deltaproteobacteria bacterium]|nr:carboxypeptidase regulatory-like domain-containing protein [Deltaproteobacteria bacterium]